MQSKNVIETIRVCNHFEYLGPLSRSELFFDRVQELNDALVVCEQIIRGTTGGVLVLGGRGSGKTSFLHELKERLSSRGIPNAKIALDEGMVQEGNESLFFKTVLTELVKASQEAGLLERKLASKVVELLSGLARIEEIGVELFGFNLIAKASKEELVKRFPYTVLRDGLKDFLKLINEKGSGKVKQGAILLLDEGDALTLNRNLLQILRNVFQETPKIGLVIAGSMRLLTQVSDVFSPIPRFFRKIELGPYPADSIVYDAIRIPLAMSQKELADKGIRVEFIHTTFDRIVTQITGRMPMEVNMLCHFAYDLAAKRIPRRLLQSKKFKLYMRIDRELLDEAIKQLGGAKEYNSFIAELNKNETSCLVLLSKSFEEETIDEIAVLIALHELKDALQIIPVEDICKMMEKAISEKEKILKLLNSILVKGRKHGISVLSSTLMGKLRFAVEDQWVRSYFKYGWMIVDVDLELGLKPRFGGIRVFGDPIATIVHSVFFPRLASSFSSRSRSFRAHVGADDGHWLRVGRNLKILNVSYIRSATNSPYHIAFQVREDADLMGIKESVEILMTTAKKVGLVNSFNVALKYY